MRRILPLILGLALVVSSCQKEIDFDLGPGGGPGGGNTGGTYQPLTKNSYWKYRETGTFSGDFTLTSTGEKRTQNGIEYTVFAATPPATPPTPSEELFGIKNHNYYAAFKGASPNTGAPFDLSMLYLNDTASVGFTWDHNAGQGNGATAYTPGIILEKGISMVVAGKNYDNVIHSQIVLQYEIPGFGTLSFATYDYYVAKNIGIIRIESTGDPILAPGVHTISDLLEYSIK